MAGRIVLGPNQYGKAEVRLVRIDRDTERHRITDLNVTSQLRGDFRKTHSAGDNSNVIPTDTQKNTIYAFARDGVGAPEELLIRLACHFENEFGHVSGGTFTAEQYAWERIADHDHAFVREGRETRTVEVTIDGEGTTVVAGLKDCTVLKSTDSEFHGFLRDQYTTLSDTTDRILATSLTATWRYAGDGTGIDYDATYAGVRDLLLSTFAERHSYALQQTIFEMGEAVLQQYDEIAEISMSCPNKHHFLVDLEPFGLDNPGTVFYAADRPYGLIQVTVLREEV